VLPRTGFINHIGIGVPDLAVTKEYYDDLNPHLDYRSSDTHAPQRRTPTGTPIALSMTFRVEQPRGVP
jgi:hypothetical protein